MFTVKGKYNTAHIYATTVDDNAISQILDVCNMEIFSDSTIAIMPDVHAGAGCTIGTTMTLKDKVVPNLVGVDIGCGMETVLLAEREIDMEKLDNLIKNEIPYGRNIRKKSHPLARNIDLSQLKSVKCIRNMTDEYRSIGSLGGGNHFIEIDKDETGQLYLVIHSGSRHLGKLVAQYYQNLAYKQCNQFRQNQKDELNAIIQNLKNEGRENEIQQAISDYKKNFPPVSKGMAYCSNELFDDYIHDMKIMQKFADINRKAIVQSIVDGMNLHVIDQFTTVHNYIDIDNMILRKGAVSAQKGQKLLIPINMAEGSLICEGKSNPDYNYSAPHGAGRIMSRTEAFNSLSVEQFQKRMEGIYTTTANQTTLDESPMAYKNMQEIIDNIQPTAEIINIIKPVYNFKAEE